MYVVVDKDSEGHGGRYYKEVISTIAAAKKENMHKDILDRLPMLQAQREQARKEKNFELADKIRSEIEAAGLQVRDGKIGD